MKKKKAVKVILWILAAIFVIAAIGVGGLYYYWKFEVIPRLMPSASPGVAGEVIPETALPENAGEVLIEQVEAIIQENDMQDYLNQESPKEAGRLLNLLEAAKKKKEAQRQERIQAEIPAPVQETLAPVATEKPKTAKSAYEKYKDQIDPRDLAAGLALASKVDVGYIMGLLSGGLTSEERSELKKYLMQRMSSSEISKGIQLFSKYSYLL